MKLILDRDYTFVTNNRTDFVALYGRTQLNAGLVIIVPNVTPTLQRELFEVALRFINERELMNAVVEVEYRGKEIECRQYPIASRVRIFRPVRRPEHLESHSLGLAAVIDAGQVVTTRIRTTA